MLSFLIRQLIAPDAAMVIARILATKKRLWDPVLEYKVEISGVLVLTAMRCGITLGLILTGTQTMTAFRYLAVQWSETLKSMSVALSFLSFDPKLFEGVCVVGRVQC